MSLKLHNVPAMPQLAMLGDNGGVVTVNPDWCDWYEEVFNEPAGTGYIKGREIMQQVDAVYSEFVGVRSEAVKSAIHTMMQRDPNTTGSRFNTIAEARASINDHAKFAMDFDKAEGVFTFDGYFSVKDMEAILFIRRAEELIELAKEKYGSFIEGAGVTGGWENVDVNQLMQVLTPGQEVTDIDSTIFAAPVAEPYKPSPMAETFNSVVEAKAVLERSGILRQNFARQPGLRSFMMDGYFEPQDLEALLYLYRNNDPMVFPEKDANGLPKDKPVSIAGEFENGVTGLADLLPGNTSSEKAILPTGNEVLNRMITEGGGLRRGEWPGEVASRTAINCSHVAGGVATHSFEKGDDDYQMLSELLKKLENFEELFDGLELGGMRSNIHAPWANDGVVYFVKQDGFFEVVLEKNGGNIRLFSLKLADNGIIVVFEHVPMIVGYGGIVSFLEVFNAVTPEQLQEAKLKALGKTLDVVSSMLDEQSQQPEPGDTRNQIGRGIPDVDHPMRLDVTGRPLPKFIITDSIGGNAVEKDLTVLREMDADDLSESLDWIIKGYPLSERDDQRFIGFTLNDFVKVAAERIKQLQSDNYSLQSDVSGLQHQIDN